MKGVEPSADGFTVHFDPDEAGLLAGVVDQLTEILDQAVPGAPRSAPATADDPFAAWEAEFAAGDATVPDLEVLDDPDGLDDVDPVVRRLFPDAYRDDPAASDDFRRFTQPALAAEKLAQARTVIADLQRTDRRGRCRVAAAHTGAWLVTLTNVRLALAVRLGITDETSADEASQHADDDPRSWLYEVYAWTGWLQESVIGAL